MKNVSNSGVTVISQAQNVTAESVASVQAPLVYVAHADALGAAAAAPIWCKRAEVERLTGVPISVLSRWVSDGSVSVAKLGDARQAATVYKLSDVLAAIERSVTRGAG